MRFNMTRPSEVVMGVRGALLVCLLGSCFANGPNSTRLHARDLQEHHPNDGHNHTARDEASASASASSDNGPVPSILPPFKFRTNLPGVSSSASASAESTNNGLLPSFDLGIPGFSSASAQSSSGLPSFPFSSGSSDGASASAAAESSSSGDSFSSFPFGSSNGGASAGASSSVSTEGGVPVAVSGAGVVVTSGPQSSPLEPFCSCVVRGNCAGREAYTRQFDAVAHLQCGGEFERCCYPCPYPGMIDNFAHVIPCSPIETCNRYYGQAPTDIAQFGVLGPCPGMGTVRCIDYLLHTQAHTTVSQDVQVDVTAEPQLPPPAPVAAPVPIPQVAVPVPVVQFIPDPPAPVPVVQFVPHPVAPPAPVPVVQFIPNPVAPPAPVVVPGIFWKFDEINAPVAPASAAQADIAAVAHEEVKQNVANQFASTAGYIKQQQPYTFSQVYPQSLWNRWGNNKNKFTLEDLFNPFKKWKKLLLG